MDTFISALENILKKTEQDKRELHLTKKPDLVLFMPKEDFEWLMDNTCYGKLNQGENRKGNLDGQYYPYR